MSSIEIFEFTSHVAVLLFIQFFSFRRLKNTTFDIKIFVSFISFWTALILSSLALSIEYRLGDNELFFVSDLVGQMLINLLILRLWRSFDSPREKSDWTFLVSGWQMRVFTFSVFSVCIVLFYLAFHVPLQIPDTLSIKLPNAFLYLKSGGFLAPTNLSDDGRLFSTPFNGTILWIYLIRWHQPKILIILLNLFCWILLAGAIYRITRELGGKRSASLLSSFLLCFSLPLLFQATSDNDDLLCSIAAVVGVVFFLRWLRSRQVADILLAGLGIAISTGAKMFPALYLPAAVCAFISFCFRRDEYFLRRLAHLSLLPVLSVLFLAPFIYARSQLEGTFQTGSPLLNASANKPFRAAVAIHNLLAYNGQALISPFADAVTTQPGPARDALTAELNSLALRLVPDVKDVSAYGEKLTMVHRYLYENTAWFGFLSVLILLSIFYFLRKRRWSLAFWFAIFFICWDIFFCVRSKYIEELGRYWILPFALATPIVGIFWQENSRKIIRFIFLLVIVTTITSAFFGLTKNVVRYNVLQAWRVQISEPTLSEQFLKVLTCDHLNILRKVYGYPVYNLFDKYRGKDITYNLASRGDQNMIVPAVRTYLLRPGQDFKYLAVDAAIESGFAPIGDFFAIPHFAEASSEAPCSAIGDKKATSFIVIELRAALNVVEGPIPVEVKILNRKLDPNLKFEVTVVSKTRHEVVAGFSKSREWNFSIKPDAESIEISVLKSDVLYKDHISVHQPL